MKWMNYLALSAVVRRLVLSSTMKPHLDTLVFDELEYQATLPHRPEQAVLDQFEQSWIGDFDVSRQVPRQMYHGHDRLE